MTGCTGKCCFIVMYVGWCGVCNVVMVFPVEVFVGYVGVYMFCFYLFAVYGVGFCVDVCGVVYVVECSLFLESGYCLLSCGLMRVWGDVIFVMRVIEAVLLLIACVFRHVIQFVQYFAAVQPRAGCIAYLSICCCRPHLSNGC